MRPIVPFLPMRYLPIMLFATVLFTALTAFKSDKTNPGEAAEIAAPAETVNWMTFEEAMQRMEEEPRKIFMDVYTDWCGWCKRMDANTFSHPEVAKYLNEKWYPVKFDAEQQESVTYLGKEYKFVPAGRRGYNELARAMDATSYPTTVYLDEQGNKIQSIKGYKDAKMLDKILKFFGEDHHKTKTWRDFQMGYESPISATPTATPAKK